MFHLQHGGCAAKLGSQQIQMRAGQTGQENTELLTADAGRKQPLSGKLFQHGRKILQHRITALVAMAVIDLLEMIDVSDQQRAAAPRCQRLLDLAQEGAPVRQACQFIRVRQMTHGLGHTLVRQDNAQKHRRNSVHQRQEDQPEQPVGAGDEAVKPDGEEERQRQGRKVNEGKAGIDPSSRPRRGQALFTDAAPQLRRRQKVEETCDCKGIDYAPERCQILTFIKGMAERDNTKGSHDGQKIRHMPAEEGPHAEPDKAQSDDEEAKANVIAHGKRHSAPQRDAGTASRCQQENSKPEAQICGAGIAHDSCRQRQRKHRIDAGKTKQYRRHRKKQLQRHLQKRNPAHPTRNEHGPMRVDQARVAPEQFQGMMRRHRKPWDRSPAKLQAKNQLFQNKRAPAVRRGPLKRHFAALPGFNSLRRNKPPVSLRWQPRWPPGLPQPCCHPGHRPAPCPDGRRRPCRQELQRRRAPDPPR